MKTNIVFTIALLFIAFCGVNSRPAQFFANEIAKDESGFLRYDGLAPSYRSKRSSPTVPPLYISLEAKLNEGVLNFDHLSEIESIECHTSHLYFSLVTGKSVPIWPIGTIIIGGVEWGCTNKNGDEVPISVTIVGEITEEENRYKVSTLPTASEQVYEHIKLSINDPSRMKRADVIGDPNIGQHRWNYESGVAQRLPILNRNCSSLSDENKETCALGGEYSVSITCSNCWATHDFSLVYTESNTWKIPQRVTVSGNVKANLEFELSTNGNFKKYMPSVLDLQVPFYAISILSISGGFYLDVSLDLNVAFTGQGVLTFGARSEGCHEL
eukprot:TRINITY_DN13941_c0_g1_i1.p1 TRINITY_DN13941_c0_g1~~TRINITY_DN13941_c0_g1_i1.p1  ORF type:complete len:380 (+),score=76.19 TRINITY_DN13941_c0_g1_i1:162-1142(+)